MSIFTNMKDLMNMASKAKEIQANLKKAQDEIQKFQTTASDSSGQVTVTVTGDFFINKVSIIPDCAALKDRRFLEEAIAESYNKALTQLKLHIQERMKDATGGLDIPGLIG